MAEEKLRLPSSGGGIMRYSDDTKSKLQIDKMVIIGIIVLIIVVEIVLYKIV